MKKKILCILVLTLLIVTIIPIVGSTHQNYQNQIFNDITSVNNNRYCKDDKNNYRFPVMNDILEPLDPKNASPKPAIIDTPDYFSWKDYEGQDWTTPVKNQSDCGCCWDFAAIGALESIINIREGNAELDLDLSEQYVLSCIPEAGSCWMGNYAYWAFCYMRNAYIMGNYYNGVIPESCFPYVGVDSFGCDFYDCDKNPVSCDEKCDNWVEELIPIKDYGYWIPDGSSEDREAIKSQIMQHGPICSAMAVRNDLIDWGYENQNPNDYYPYYPAVGIGHIVTIVGWKDDPTINKGGYWIIKNSWGTDWGYDGFFNLEYKSLNIDSFQIDWVDYETSDNWKPNKPTISGDKEGEIGEELTFSTTTTDPNELQLYYMWDWGNETTSDWIGLYNSGESVSTSHSWTEEGVYKVRVKAKNTNEKESEWSNIFTVCIPKNNDGDDQKQGKYDGRYRCWKGAQLAQSFIPSKNTITMVQLYMNRIGNPVKLTISIRDELENMDLTSIVITPDMVPETSRWIECDFPDINVIPGETYYIVWDPIAFDMDNTFLWGYGSNDPYPNGCAWRGPRWTELVIEGYPDPDFCFKTYHPKSKNKVIELSLHNFLQQHPNLFPILRQLLQKL
ncbi:MAG: PKD domain-containing protein [Thermoplasmatales archaeon]|nr:MAG: PKD domain-containing protein [Thermoplasmatales archaeon]